MKRVTITLLTTVFIGLQAQAQHRSVIRAEIAAPLCTRTLRASFGHQIDKNWSISAEMGINMKRLIKATEDETLTHWNTLSVPYSTGSEREFRDNLTEVCLHAQYWPYQAYDGPMFSMGGAVKDRKQPDIITGCGYSFHIWKGLRADLQYQIYIIESIKTLKISPDGIRIGISYVFQ